MKNVAQLEAARTVLHEFTYLNKEQIALVMEQQMCDLDFVYMVLGMTAMVNWTLDQESPHQTQSVSDVLETITKIIQRVT